MMAINLESVEDGRGMQPDGDEFARSGTFLGLPLLRSFPLVTALLFACCVWIAVTAHEEQSERVRAGETERVLAEFESEPVASAWARLSDAWEAEGARQQVLVQRAAPHGIQPSAGVIVSRDHQFLVLETVNEYELADDIDTVLRYFQRVAYCIRLGGCDGAAAAAHFGADPWRFRNQHYPHLIDTYPDEPFDTWFAIVSPPEPEIPAVLF